MTASTYTVTIEVSVTADNPQEAAQYALDDLRDETLGPWEMGASNDSTGSYHVVEVGEPEESD
jgi:hypothetical protein